MVKIIRLIKILIWHLFIIFYPPYWFMNDPFSREWDEELNRLMSDEPFMNITDYKASIGRYSIWIANHPYASFTIEHSVFNNLFAPVVRPRRWTIHKARRKLIRDYFKQKEIFHGRYQS